ncbi:hypothetical protein ACL02U_04785 [Streptomyces sp. MS06]|uniref:hypothetical protein n=1 Tax=Streptomyces sp. MS06 TaxID=3385974 RepID=UPI00399FE63F
MPRGRHRHSPPLHRLLPPSAIAGVSVVCALGPWVFTHITVLRTLAAVAAATALVGAAVMRRWDGQAGKRVADLTRARASDEWRHEERIAELETDLDESRELRGKLEQRLRAKRAELAGLRNEHAALLRRYATAETERASALEGRRRLEIEAAPSSRALPPAPAGAEDRADTSRAPGTGAAETPESAVAGGAAHTAPSGAGAGAAGAEDPAVTAVFSPEGSRLFLRANDALSRLVESRAAQSGRPAERTAAQHGTGTPPERGAAEPGAASGEPGGRGGASARGEQEDEAAGKPEAADAHARAAAVIEPPAAVPESAAEPAPEPAAEPAPEPAAEPAPESAVAPAGPAAPRSGGHFTVPTAVAVAPPAPRRRPVAEGGFDFFGTKNATKAAPTPDALEAVQNQDLADVVGEEALAVHKAEAEAGFKRADPDARGVGQVIDLTAHDETEQIDLQGLRSAVS